MLAIIGVSIWTVGVVIAVAVGTYLFLRNNKNKKAKIDAAVDEVKKHL